MDLVISVQVSSMRMIIFYVLKVLCLSICVLNRFDVVYLLVVFSNCFYKIIFAFIIMSEIYESNWIFTDMLTIKV